MGACGSSAGGGRQVTFVVVGLDNAGKTTIVNDLIGKEGDAVNATTGFELQQFQRKHHSVKLYGLGGGAGIRGYWNNYYDEVHGIMFVVDAADPVRLDLVRDTFQQMLGQQYVQGKPILIFANKQDLPGALSAAEISTRLGLDKLSDSPHSILATTALVDKTSANKSLHRVDKAIFKGFDWLLNTVEGCYAVLDARIKIDVAERKKKEKQKLNEQRARVAQYKEEEAKAAALAAAAAGGAGGGSAAEAPQPQQDGGDSDSKQPASLLLSGVNKGSEASGGGGENDDADMMADKDGANEAEAGVAQAQQQPLSSNNINDNAAVAASPTAASSSSSSSSSSCSSLPVSAAQPAASALQGGEGGEQSIEQKGNGTPSPKNNNSKDSDSAAGAEVVVAGVVTVEPSPLGGPDEVVRVTVVRQSGSRDRGLVVSNDLEEDKVNRTDAYMELPPARDLIAPVTLSSADNAASSGGSAVATSAAAGDDNAAAPASNSNGSVLRASSSKLSISVPRPMALPNAVQTPSHRDGDDDGSGSAPNSP